MESSERAMTDYLPALEVEAPPGASIGASIIWLHGLGADGNDFAPLAPQLSRTLGLSAVAGTRFVFPHAPTMPVAINDGHVMPAWYDITHLGATSRGNMDQLRVSAARVHDLIDREVARGVAPARIVAAGFSQGGAVALEAALTYPQRLAGALSLSSYFATARSVKVQPAQRGLPVLICHGSGDGVVPESLGYAAADTLGHLGMVAEFKSYPMAHTVCAEEIEDISRWLRTVLDLPQSAADASPP